jgi:polyhydroxybutyrate depolymerase
VNRYLFFLCAVVVTLLQAAPAAASTALAPLPATPSAGRYAISLTHDGRERTALVHIPNRYRSNAKLPLLLLLHGGGGSAASALDEYGWAAKSERAEFLVIAPDGLGVRPDAPARFTTNPAVWNSGQYESRTHVDDVGFVRQLLDLLKTRVPHDESRVFITGHSNGGGMAFRLAAEMPERFAAIAMVAGRLAVTPAKLKKPMPTLYIVGTEDPLMPLAGGKVNSPWAGSWSNRPVAEQLATWAEALGCDKVPKALQGGEPLTRTLEYPSQSAGPTLVALYLEGHGHHWPGAKVRLPSRVMGPVTSKIVASDVIWDFLDRGALSAKRASK